MVSYSLVDRLYIRGHTVIAFVGNCVAYTGRARLQAGGIGDRIGYAGDFFARCAGCALGREIWESYTQEKTSTLKEIYS